MKKHIAVFMLLSLLLSGCNNDNHNVNNPVYVVEQTISVSTEMWKNTAIDGCGAFNPCDNTD